MKVSKMDRKPSENMLPRAGLSWLLGACPTQPGTAPTPQGPPVTSPTVGAAGHVASQNKVDPAVKYVPQETDQAPLPAYLLCGGV